MTIAARGERRRPRPRDRPAAVALLLGLAGVGYRLTLILLDVPGGNSDEATFGLAALHIAEGRHWPVYLYGQHYMGVLESYLAAPLFALFGPSWLLLRLPLLGLYALFVYLVHRLARQLFSPWLATVTVGLLALGSERVVRDQMTAVGGRAEAKPAVVLLLLIALALAHGRVRRPRLALGLCGVVAGAACWSDWLVLPYLGAAAAVLLAGARGALRGGGAALLLGGLVVGAAPMLVDNLAAGPGQDSLSVFRELASGPGGPAPLAAHLRGGLLEGVPLATGLCPSAGCAPWQLAWGALYVPLLLAAATLAVVDAWRSAHADARTAGDGVDDRLPAGEAARTVARLALAAAALVTVAGYARSSAAATTPLASARYLAYLQISLPVALWPLWRAAAGLHRRRLGRRVGGLAARATLAALVAAMGLGTAGQISAVGAVRAEERRARALADTLTAAGVTEVYGEYWTCNRLTFNTRERVACAVVGADLRPGQDRYLPYRRRVNSAPRPAYVLVAEGPADLAFRARLAARGVPAEVTETGGYRVYLPAAPVRPGR